MKEGISRGIIEFPFTMKLFEDTFWRVEDEVDFENLLDQVVEFRLKTIKKAWAIKYGVSYEGVDYPNLEDLSEQELLSWKDPRENVKYSLDDISEHDLLHGRSEH